MNSPKKLNYELRPAKFTERKMLLASLINICNYYKCDFQYVGFGGISFTDFKLFHRELHINQMISIEGGTMPKERIEFNIPYSFIKLKFGNSNSILPKLDLFKKTIVWLDYECSLENSIFTDIETLFKKLPTGSIYIVTCNRELKNSDGDLYNPIDFKEEYGELVPFELDNKDFGGEDNFKTIRKMLLTHIDNILNERKMFGENLKFHQLYNFLYEENRGARMYTFGGIIETSDFNVKELNLDSFKFIMDKEQPYRIKIPNLTFKEIDFINSKFYEEEELLNSKIVLQNQINQYKESYKYLPNYLDVRM